MIDKNTLTAMDAGINRAIEGLRVCEDIFRFSVRNELSYEFKSLRHSIVGAIRNIPPAEILNARDVASDSQKFINSEGETSRSGIKDVFRSNIRRAAESVRSLEEFSKTFSPETGVLFQTIRFKIYEAEKSGWFILSKHILLEKFRYRLYAIIDSLFVKESEMISTASTLIDSGAGIIQLRMKDSSDSDFLAMAKNIFSICMEKDVLFIINDRPDIAVLSGAHGLHMGQDDISVSEARKVTGESMLIGLTTHNLEEAAAGIKGTADYIAVGPVFPTVTKRGDFVEGIGTEIVRKICSFSEKPVVCIGGINHENLKTVMETGCTAAAVVSSLYTGGNISLNARRFAETIFKYSSGNGSKE